MFSKRIILCVAELSHVSLLHEVVVRLFADSLPFLPLTGESVVPELHGSSVLLSASSHLLLSRAGLPHDAAGRTPAVFHFEVHTLKSLPLDCQTKISTGSNNCSNYSDVGPATWLNGGSTWIAIKSRSGSAVTFLLSCNQSGGELMCPGHRLSISLAQRHTCWVIAQCAVMCTLLSFSFPATL